MVEFSYAECESVGEHCNQIAAATKAKNRWTPHQRNNPRKSRESSCMIVWLAKYNVLVIKHRSFPGVVKLVDFGYSAITKMWRCHVSWSSTKQSVLSDYWELSAAFTNQKSNESYERNDTMFCRLDTKGETPMHVSMHCVCSCTKRQATDIRHQNCIILG